MHRMWINTIQMSFGYLLLGKPVWEKKAPDTAKKRAKPKKNCGQQENSVPMRGVFMQENRYKIFIFL